MKKNVVTAAQRVGLVLISSVLLLALGINLAVAPHRAKPSDRSAELLLDPEPLRQIEGERRCFWLLAYPPCLTYERISGTMEP